jgi:hypothetical protein
MNLVTYCRKCFNFMEPAWLSDQDCWLRTTGPTLLFVQIPPFVFFHVKKLFWAKIKKVSGCTLVSASQCLKQCTKMHPMSWCWRNLKLYKNFCLFRFYRLLWRQFFGVVGYLVPVKEDIFLGNACMKWSVLGIVRCCELLENLHFYVGFDHRKIMCRFLMTSVQFF